MWARRTFYRAPFVVEGMIIGALGAIIPILFTIFGYIFIYDKLGGVLFSEMFKMTPPHPFVLQLSLILLGIGMVVGDRQLHVGDEISEVETMKK